ncbi:MAG TPA: glycosyltransferase family 4 protein [Burkholderiaceae bacterium]
MGDALRQEAGVAAAAPLPIRVALVTNIPAPYRLPIYDLLAEVPGIELKVYFCSGREPDRQWDLAALRAEHFFFRERFLTFKGRFIHFNSGVWRALSAQQPQAVVTTGFNPTHLAAFAYARRKRVPHIPMTDGTVESEAKLTPIHRLVRRYVYARSSAFVGASEGSKALYRQYGVADPMMFKSHLCTDNERFERTLDGQRPYDFIFSGRFAVGKQPLFALQVAADAARKMGRQVKLLFVGAGDLEPQMRREVVRLGAAVQADFAGFASQGDLPDHYAKARLMLFPTLDDTWGVVANEACASGLPVLVSPQAGVAGELVRDGQNGRVLPLDVDAWSTACAEVLSNAGLWRQMAERSRQLVAPYTYANAADGLHQAIRYSLKPGRP